MDKVRVSEQETETPEKRKRRKKCGEYVHSEQEVVVEAEVLGKRKRHEEQTQVDQEKEKVTETRLKKRKRKKEQVQGEEEKQNVAEPETEVMGNELGKNGEKQMHAKQEKEPEPEVTKKKKRKRKDIEQEKVAENVAEKNPSSKTDVEVPSRRKHRINDDEQEKEKLTEPQLEVPRKNKRRKGEQEAVQDESSTKCMKRKKRLELIDTKMEAQLAKLEDGKEHADHVKHKKKGKNQEATVQNPETEIPSLAVKEAEPDTKKKDEEEAVEFWSKLPPELEQRILAKLPVEHIFTIQRTCRAFRNVTASPGFREMWRSSERAEQSTVLIRYRYSTRNLSRCYSTAAGRWCNVPNSFFLPKDGFQLKDAKNGLVAARLPKKIAVGNPVTQEWVYIDPEQAPEWQKSPWSLLVPRERDGSRFDFRLLISDRFYDSRAGKWEQINLPGDTAYGSVYCDGISAFYYLCEDEGHVKLVSGSMDDPRNFEVLRSWSRDEFKYPLYHQLVDYQGELGLISDSSQSVRGLSFHVFDVVSRAWIRKSCLPKEMSLRVLKEQKSKKKKGEREIWQFATSASGGVSFVVPSGCSGFVLFDARNMTWRWIDDPALAVPMQRRSELFCSELSF